MKTVSALTLGCKVNQYDTSAMLGLLRAAGYETVPWGAASDVALVNTCTVTQTADRKSRSAIRQAARRGSSVCVCGCLAQKQKDELLKIEGVRWVVGTAERGRIAEIIASGSPAVLAGARNEFEELHIGTSGSRTRAFVKVQEGCANFCSYCIIPFVRGRPQSRSRASVVEEISRLCEAGVPEVVLTGIDLASYRNGGDLADLVGAIGELTPLRRLRLGSLEPGLFTDDFTRRLAKSDILCPHFHLSLQSGSEAVLQAMNRRYTPDDFLREVDRLRSCFELPAISTDVMTGFPGESPEDFGQTLRLVRRAAFARLHVFPYSQREGTAAASMPGQIPGAERKHRALELIAAGEELEEAYAQAVLPLIHSVLFEDAEGEEAAGYSERYVRVQAPGGEPGKVVSVRTETAQGATLFGQIATEGPSPC